MCLMFLVKCSSFVSPLVIFDVEIRSGFLRQLASLSPFANIFVSKQEKVSYSWRGITFVYWLRGVRTKCFFLPLWPGSCHVIILAWATHLKLSSVLKKHCCCVWYGQTLASFTRWNCWHFVWVFCENTRALISLFTYSLSFPLQTVALKNCSVDVSRSSVNHICVCERRFRSI